VAPGSSGVHLPPSGDDPDRGSGTSPHDEDGVIPGMQRERADANAASDEAIRPPVSPSTARSGPGQLRSRSREAVALPEQVERLVALIHEELRRPGQRRLAEIEPDRWWLADRADRDAAAPPLADRVEWAVYSLLSTAGPLSETAFFQRIAALFTGHDLPDETLVRACLQSYRSLASTPDRLVTNESLPRRSAEHTELLAALARGGHRLGMRVWLGARQQSRRLDGRPLADWLDDRELGANLHQASRGPIEELEAVDCIWYVRGQATFMFEVEWTAMLGDTILRRHGRIPQDERLVRFLVVPPERTELIRHKLERSPLLRAGLEEGNWHMVKWNYLRSYLARDPLDLSDLEPYLGLDPVVERTGEQLPLFGE
jgi:hypothetical protein